MNVLILIGLLYISIDAKASIAEEIKALHEHSYTLLDTNKDSAFQIGVKTELMSRKAGLIWEEANSIFIQAWTLDMGGHSGEAFPLYIKALNLLEPVIDEEERLEKLYFDMIGNTGHILSYHEAYNAALSFFDKAYTMALSRKNYNAVTQILRLKSIVYQKKNDFEQANTLIDEALTYSKKIDTLYYLSILNQKSLILLEQKATEEAKKHLYTMLDIAQENNQETYKALAYHNIGYVSFTENKYDQALEYILISDSLTALLGDSYSYFQLLLDLTEMHLSVKNYHQALKSGDQASSLYKEVQIIPSHYILFSFLSKTHSALGQYKEAQYYSERYMEENEKYLEAKAMLSQIKEKYQMEELAASFVNKTPINEDSSHFWITVFVVSAGLSVLIFIGKNKIVGIYLLNLI